MQIENVILENLIHNEEYTRRVLPFLKDEYFHEKSHAIVFGRIADHMGRFNTPPTQDELLVELANKNGLTQGDFEQSVDLVNTLSKRHRAHHRWNGCFSTRNHSAKRRPFTMPW